jgi:uncharacterized protein (UPF0264 family)
VTWLLASVRDAAEAETALSGGADIIDLKEPAAGALGAVPPRVAREVTRLVDGRVPVSATVGDLPMHPAILRDAVRAMAAIGVCFIKVGLFDEDLAEPCLRALAPLARGSVGLVAVMFADRGPDPRSLDLVAGAGFHGAMLDTADKRHGGLRAHLSDRALGRYLERARSLGLMAGLAGSLGLDDIAPLLRLDPGYLGFRGALCVGRDRAAALDGGTLAAVRRRIPQAASAAPHPDARWASQATATAGAQSDTLSGSPAVSGKRLANSR